VPVATLVLAAKYFFGSREEMLTLQDVRSRPFSWIVISIVEYTIHYQPFLPDYCIVNLSAIYEGTTYTDDYSHLVPGQSWSQFDMKMVRHWKTIANLDERGCLPIESTSKGWCGEYEEDGINVGYIVDEGDAVNAE
jgi:hypothetical protein